jgi:hypothetical protein
LKSSAPITLTSSPPVGRSHTVPFTSPSWRPLSRVRSVRFNHTQTTGITLVSWGSDSYFFIYKF